MLELSMLITWGKMVSLDSKIIFLTLQNQWCMVYMIGHLSQKNIYMLHELNMDNSSGN